MFRASMCPSSGARATNSQWTHYLLTGSDSLPAATAKYQHVAITLLSRQLLKMGTWLPETCWATCKGEIKDNTKWHLVGFLSTLNYDARSTTHQTHKFFSIVETYIRLQLRKNCRKQTGLRAYGFVTGSVKQCTVKSRCTVKSFLWCHYWNNVNSNSDKH